MFATPQQRRRFEVLSIVVLFILFVITVTMGLVYRSDHPLITHAIINPEIGKFISFGIFIAYVAIFYFAILRKYNFLITDWHRRNTKNQIEHQAIIDCCLPAWKKIQVFIVICFILGMLFLDPLDAGISIICCELLHAFFRYLA